jgi:hypothetical protein
MNSGIETLNENETILLSSIYNEQFPYTGILVPNLNNKSINLNNFLSINKDSNLENIHLPPSPPKVNSSEEISTEFPSKQNNYNEPLLYSFDIILNIFKMEEHKIKFNDIINKFNEEKAKEQLQLLEKKRKRTFYDDEYNYIYELMDKTKQSEYEIMQDEPNNNNNKRGRKTNKTKNVSIHDKMVPDNIIKKIKAKIFEYPIVFLNNILNNNKEEDKLFKLDYKFINKLNREQDLKYLDMSLKELYSKEISPKYIKEKRQEDSNKIYISKILNNQKDNTILFVFNMTFRDWLDLFTLKKSINDIITKYDYLAKDIDCERIQKSLYGVDNLLKKIMNENDKEYLTMYIFFLYNYERWFYNKKGRISKPKTKNKQNNPIN